MGYYRVGRAGFPLPLIMGSLWATLLTVVVSVFTALEWAARRGLLPQITVPGFDFTTVQAVMFLFLLFLSIFSVGFTAAGYFLFISFLAYFCRVNSAYAPLAYLAQILFIPERMVLQAQSYLGISPELAADLGTFLNLLVFLFLAAAITRENRYRLRIRVEPQMRYFSGR